MSAACFGVCLILADTAYVWQRCTKFCGFKIIGRSKTKKGNRMYSEVDYRGKLSVDCSECERGGNGSSVRKCSCGWKVKKPLEGACFMGDLLPKFHEEARRKIEEVAKLRTTAAC